MRPDTVYCLQMFRVHQKTGKFISVKLQTKQDAASHIVNSAFHRSIHSFRMIVIIMFRTGRMEFQIALLMVGLLEQNIGSNPGLF